ncbi:MAG: CRISPR system precrRNA processing endoribonuclease RAMP protein Cas6 [Anaerolineales bacterium]|nr:CRISPR system precrRNA processing endoribonuclease RAMP protein Cas6 [Chloroflexi bacterium CFX1]MCK6540841.1 CRISPR system precrRNA processing endoribonuclease RAMP protein Cas6 [Anaerolineales bacterium]MCQ3952980.1 hypothetical protein [Chloroflexota bacterium]MDL1919493.1 CRISPR system precrRNA processing endoribonuclease RAMP protein Cas6 [Chloroflexi bacterium CFX5]
MLTSTVFHLKALERGSLPQYMGAAARSEFLRWMGVSEDESDELHDGNRLRPYTVSDLRGTFRAQKGFNLVEAGGSAWFRATTLREKESLHLRDSVIPSLRGRIVQLGRVSFEVQSVAEAGEHPWAGASSYSALAGKYFESDSVPADALEVEFASLTTFHDGDLHMPLPIPETTLGSWLKRWDHFSSASLPQAVEELKEAKLALSRYELKSGAVQYKNADWIGFTGLCRYRVLAKDEFWARLCNLLAEYAFYCGTGYKTTFGLGQTRRI